MLLPRRFRGHIGPALFFITWALLIAYKSARRYALLGNSRRYRNQIELVASRRWPLDALCKIFWTCAGIAGSWQGLWEFSHSDSAVRRHQSYQHMTIYSAWMLYAITELAEHYRWPSKRHVCYCFSCCFIIFHTLRTFQKIIGPNCNL